MQQAKKSGADGIKFQIFEAEELSDEFLYDSLKLIYLSMPWSDSKLDFLYQIVRYMPLAPYSFYF